MRDGRVTEEKGNMPEKAGGDCWKWADGLNGII